MISSEPDAETFERLCHNLNINAAGNVVPVRAALAAQAGTVSLRSCPNSLYSSLYMQVDGRRNDGTVQDVPAMTIDQVMETTGVEFCQFLKMDCEGAEHEVFQTMPPATAARIAQIGMELHSVEGIDSSATARRLHDFGFRSDRRDAL